MTEEGKPKFNFKFGDFWITLTGLFVVLFILTGFLVGWAGMTGLAIFQPILFMFVFLSLLRARGLGRNEVLFLALIFLLGFAIRAQNIQPRYTYFFGFDSYYHGRMIEYIVADGGLPEIDPLAYYELPDAQRAVPSAAVFFWYVCAGVNWLFTMFGPYSRELWLEILKILPAFFGALTAMLMYFLGKELWGKKAGYVAAFIAAVIPSYVYRTMAGFLEDDALGFFWLVTGLIFFVRALKNPAFDREHIVNALLAGVFFAGMAASWGFFLIIPILLLMFFPFCTLFFLSREEIRNQKILAALFVSFVSGLLFLGQGILTVLIGAQISGVLSLFFLAVTIASIGFMLFEAREKEKEFFALVSLYLISSFSFFVLTFFVKGLEWFGTMLNYVEKAVPVEAASAVGSIGLIVVGAFLLLIAGFFIFIVVFGTKNPEKRRSLVRNLTIAGLVLIVIATIIILWDPNGLFSSGLQTSEVFLSTVGEEGAGHPHFPYKYGILIAFPFIALIVLPLFHFINKKDYLTPLAFLWIATSLVMAWYKLKFTYHFGLPIAIAAAGLAGVAFYLFKDFKSIESKLAVLAIAFMMLCGLAIGGYFVTQRSPSLENDALWKETLFFMRDELPEGAKLMNWWSYGHWITFVSGKAVFADNRNVQWDISDGHFAKFLMSQNLEESLELAREYQPEYILVDNSMFQSFYSFAIYNYQMKGSDLGKNIEIAQLLFFAQPPGSAEGLPFANFHAPCSSTPSQDNFNCVYFQFNAEQLESVSDTWTVTPHMTEAGIPVWNYREEDNSGFSRLLSTVNNSTLARLWFHDPETMQYFEEIYKKSDSARTIKIFKVKNANLG